jgi:hypothetical protein
LKLHQEVTTHLHLISIGYTPSAMSQRVPTPPSPLQDKSPFKGDSFGDEPVNMMDLLKQMNSTSQTSENIHPNTDVGNDDSFSSDDILETLDLKDTKKYIPDASNINTTNTSKEKAVDDEFSISTTIQSRVEELTKMTDNEFSKHIEQTLLPNLQVSIPLNY